MEIKPVSPGDLGWPLDRAAGLYGPEAAVTDARATVTYTELLRRVGALRVRLDELAVGEGSRVGFLGVNSLAHVECWMAVPSAGRVLVDLNFRLSPAELQYIVDDCAIELLIVDSQQLAVARGLRTPARRWRSSSTTVGRRVRRTVLTTATLLTAGHASRSRATASRWRRSPTPEGRRGGPRG